MSDQQHLKDYHREARIFNHRVIVVAILVLGLLGILVARFYTLQVVHHRDYATLSDRNRVRVQAIPPTRGLIFDRNDVLLADNRPSYTLSLIKEHIDDLPATIELLGDLLPVTERDVERFHKRLKQRRRPYEAVPLRYRLTEQEIAKLAVNEYRLEGVEVEALLVRHYPLGSLLAHSVGYVGRINERELADFDPEEYQRYSGTHSIGKIGLEKQYEGLLLGEVGNQNIEANARGRVLRVLDRTDPVPGKNLHLFLDVALQQVAFDALGDRRGAVVAIEVATGGVLAMVSTPSFDANLFVTGISFKDYRALNESLDLPLFNRAIQAQYPPGSTLKPMLGLGALEAGTVTEQSSVRDPGYYQLQGDDHRYRDWKKGGHAHRISLKQAVAQSCDVYFYDLAFRMGIDKIHSFGSLFGLGQRSGVDLPSERAGLWPSRQWKRSARGLPWFPGDSLNVGLGQGDVLTTPLQLAAMTATIASRGVRKQPKLVRSVGEQVALPQVVEQIDIAPDYWDAIWDAMTEVVHGRRGTAQRIRRGASYRMAGKTGTAQVVGIAQGEKYDSEKLKERQRDHALFVGMAPAESPRIAVAVIVENGEHGSSAAAPVARKLFDVYLQGAKPKARGR